MKPIRVYRIIVVEDNPADVYLLRRALSQAGLQCDLTVIDDGADALAYIQSSAQGGPRPDLAVLDLNLPGHSGIEVLGSVRQSKNLTDLPVVVMTSSASLPERRQVEQLGVSRFITKPHDLNEFLQIGEVLKEVLMRTEAQANCC